jgi:molecular chaperone DnaJ
VTHYEVLGVAPTAAPADIRASYRERARHLHPDRAASGSNDADLMARVNEAYRVLGDPGRRAIYDRSLRTTSGSGGPGAAAPSSSDPGPLDDGDDLEPPVPPRHSRLAPDGPARVPWKLMLVAAILGSAVVLAAAAVTDPPSEEPPDGILRSGSCVVIEANGDAREVACTGDGDIVVELLLPTGARCPVGTMAHRDRLGLGTACIER